MNGDAGGGIAATMLHNAARDRRCGEELDVGDARDVDSLHVSDGVVGVRHQEI